MLQQLLQPENMSLHEELIKQGSKVTSKRLATEKKGTFPKTGDPGDFNDWWMMYKEGKKKKKIAMVIMAFLYPKVTGYLDWFQKKVLQLESKTNSQEEEIDLLKRKLQKQEAKNMQLTDKMSEISSEVLQLRSKRDSQKMKITALKQRVQEQEAENKRLKDYKTTLEDCNNLLRLPATVTSSLQKPLLSLLGELPDLEYSNSNYMFWAKIKRWLLNGEVAPQCVFELVQRKCPQKAWLTIAENFDNKAWKTADFSDPAKAARLLEKLWKCVSKALGPGTNRYEVYYYRKQEAGETFQTYIEEKFKLYCSFGVENTEPNKNDRNFLCNALEKAEKRYQTFGLRCSKSYDELMSMSMIVDSMLTTAEWNNECMNCGRGGHTQADCRRPGGGKEVGPDHCYTCGKYGHWARKCLAYQKYISKRW
ncbi:uncharacterized protein LOC113641509 [Tachysurus fulvidraco]|uniref:uncharacterized protein LOC113641509 n=1 Tax=Tachysurus fulvidraco TaxID=1234273 RepID=UPI001FEF656D|nr:uncharacterized protein LOC113641509 [Tachysurus fulvidraco]